MNRPAAALDGLGSPLPREGLLPPPVSRRRGACSLGCPSRLAISARYLGSPSRLSISDAPRLRLGCDSAPSRPSPGQPLANLSPPRLDEALRLPPLLPACSLLAGRTIVPAAARPGGRASCCEERLISVLSPVSRSETTGGWPTVRRSSPPRAPTHAVAAAVATPSHRRRFLFAAGADVQTELPRVHHSASGAAAAPCAAADASLARRLRPSHV